MTLYGFLLREGRISDDWFARQIEQADRTDGDIDTLSTRIAHIRTWTFAANRPDWLSDPDHWQGVTRAIEDRLSDALHERLAERFVDRRTSVLMRRLRENTMLETEITKTGEVVVEGHTIGRLDGFRFAPDTTAGTSDAKALSAAAQKALAGEIEARANKLAHAPDAQFVLTSDATIRWIGEPVAKIIGGDVVLRPRVRILADEQLTGAALEAVQTRLDLWLRTHVERLLGPLFVLSAAEDITGLARGIAYQIVETLGVLERSKVADDLKSLDQASRAVLRKHGVRFGAYHVYVPALLKPAPRSLAAQLWALKHGGPDMKGLDDLQRLAASGRTSFPADKEIQRALYRTIGYRVCAERAVRVDILERLADLIRPALAWRPNSNGSKPAGAFEGIGFTVTQAMTSLTGSSGEDFASILRALGYRMEKRPKPPEPATPPAADATADAACGRAVRRHRRPARPPGMLRRGRPGCRGSRCARRDDRRRRGNLRGSRRPYPSSRLPDAIEAAIDSDQGVTRRSRPRSSNPRPWRRRPPPRPARQPAESAIEEGAPERPPNRRRPPIRKARSPNHRRQPPPEGAVPNWPAGLDCRIARRAGTRRGLAARRPERGAPRPTPSGTPCPPRRRSPGPGCGGRRRAGTRCRSARGCGGSGNRAREAPSPSPPARAARANFAGIAAIRPEARDARRAVRPEFASRIARRTASWRPAAGLCQGPSPRSSPRSLVTTRRTATTTRIAASRRSAASARSSPIPTRRSPSLRP